MTDDIEETTDVHTDKDGEEGVYANTEKAAAESAQLRSQRGDSSDEVDPRKLVRDPTLSEIRWYYRRTFANVLVDKPIDDAFKNGFEFTSDNADEAKRLLSNPDFDAEGDGFIGAYRFAEKKARRDGFALIFLGTRESNGGLNMSPISEDVDVNEVSHLKVLTVDDLTEVVPHEQVKESTGLDTTQYEVRKTGIVINTDISSPNYRTPIGYVLDAPEPQFIHADRIIHLTWNPEVDGDYNGNGVRRYEGSSTATLGQYEGDSVLIPTYDILKGIAKGNWAIMQALFRNAAHMYTVELPTDADEEDMSNALDVTANINAKSALVFPDGYEVEQHESGNQMEPAEHYEALFDQVCAGQEMTKSVLFGTQAGTVSGSEVDIKNYFNKVERYRTNRAESKIQEYLTRVKKMEDSRTEDDYRFDVDFEWGPMFKVDRETRIQMMQNETQSLSTLIGSFALTPDEAREILSEDFTTVELDDMTESQMDVLDRINLTRSGQGQQAVRSEGEYTSAPASPSANASEGGREGGREMGQQQAQSNPASDSIADELSDLKEMYDDGLLTDDEFTRAKERLLGDKSD